MTLNEAIKFFNGFFPKYKVIGYWVNDEGYIFNTVSSTVRGTESPSQFVVRNDGKVYGTNPFLSNLNIAEMKRI